jgi:MFS family permease
VQNRWAILAVLFTVRLSVAFQFQSVPAVAPLLGAKFGVSLADIGLLIGLYFMPGVALALPGGAISTKFGDKATVAGGTVLMLAGSLAMAISDVWGWQIAGRLLTGSGGVLLNVVTTKMLTDWFAGREIATAMAIFINSWPAGLALSLLTLPAIGAASGVSAVYFAVAVMVVLALLLLVAGYRPAPDATVSSVSPARIGAKALIASIVAGLIWGLFNIGFTMIFSFGPTMLVERGWTITAAGSAISIVLWLAALSGPAGGYVSDLSNRPQTVLAVGSVLFALAMLALPRSDAVILLLIVIGVVSAPPAGPIMSLPARVLLPETRAVGMGIFYTVFYGIMVLGPAIAGLLAKWTGSVAVAFDFGAMTVLLCLPLLLLYNWLARPELPRAPAVN